MEKVLAKALSLGRYADPRRLRRLSRKQLSKLAGGLVAVYLVLLGVNAAVLQIQIGSNEVRVQGVRKTLDAMSLNLNLGSWILDKDLAAQAAVGRLGGYYLTEKRFDQIGRAELQFRRSLKQPIGKGNAKSAVDAIVRRMAVEQLVAEFARENNLTANPKEVERRIAANLLGQGGLKQLEKALKNTYNWTLADFRYEVEYLILRAKMEEALGGEKYSQAAKKGFQKSSTSKVKAYTNDYARTHTNYLASGGYDTLAKRLLSL